MIILLIAIPVIIGLLAGAGAVYDGQVTVSTSLPLLPMLLLGIGGFVVLRVIGWFASPFVGEELERLPDRAQVIPVYEYQGAYYEAPITTARDLKQVVASQRPRRLDAMPTQVPVYRARPIYPKIATAPAMPKTKTPRRGYGEPEYMVDGTLVGYRYFDRDDEGNMLSVGLGGHGKSGNWGAGENTSDRLPTEHNTSGLWAAYTPDSPFLDGYDDHDIKAIVGFEGQTVFGEKGFRAEKGKVVQILSEKPLKPGQKPLKWYQRKH